MTKLPQRIAFLGGAFDPPHPGHEMLARRVLEKKLTDLVLWVPSWSPPHKVPTGMSDFSHRLAMTRLAAEDIPGCEVSDIEQRMAFSPSYSLKILAALQKEYPESQLQLLIGQDSLEQLHTWYGARELVTEYGIIAFPRCDEKFAAGGELDLPVEFWGAELAEKLKKSLIGGECIKISSTNLRKSLAKNQNMMHIINEKVWNYIKQHGLYGVTPDSREA